jgi:hypothetical protein
MASFFTGDPVTPSGDYLLDQQARIKARSGFDQGAHDVGAFFGFAPNDNQYAAAIAPNQKFWSDLATGTAGHQGELTQMYLDSARGTGPSVAQMQLKQGTDRNMQQAAALIGSQRGYNPGAQRQIATQRAQIGQQMAGDSAMLRLQEQMQARAALQSTIQNYVKMGMTWDEATRQAQLGTIKGEDQAAGNRFGFLKDLGKMAAMGATGGGGPGAPASGGVDGVDFFSQSPQMM